MPNMAVVDNTLDYMDQASFLGLRARGRDPLIQLFWLYDHDVDLEQLRRFHHLLGKGLLGRRIERSPIPFGRHRWVAWPGPDDIEIAPTPRPRAEVREWAVEPSAKPIDPERGPSWRLAGADEQQEVFGSWHQAGVPFSMCDGSVRRISDTIAPGVLELLAMRNDRQPVSADF